MCDLQLIFLKHLEGDVRTCVQYEAQPIKIPLRLVRSTECFPLAEKLSRRKGNCLLIFGFPKLLCTCLLLEGILQQDYKANGWEKKSRAKQVMLSLGFVSKNFHKILYRNSYLAIAEGNWVSLQHSKAFSYINISIELDLSLLLFSIHVQHKMKLIPHFWLVPHT